MFEILNNSRKYKNNIALIYGEKNISYGNLVFESNKIQKFINSNTVSLLVADNYSDFVVGYLAFLRKKNTINIIVDSSFSIEFIDKIIKSFKPNYIYSSKLEEHLDRQFRKISTYNAFTLHSTNFPSHKNLNYKNFLLLTTSGTTESPKLVRLSKQNLIDNINNISNNLKIKKSHTTITTMPMGYSYGLSILNTHLYKGAKIVINKSNILEKKFWEKIRKHKVNSFGGVPEFYNFLKKIGFKKKTYSSIKYLTQAGGKMSSSTLEYFQSLTKEKKIKFYAMYGQTEAGPRMSILNWKMFLKKNDSIGQPLKNCRIELIDKKKNKIRKPNISGEIVFRGKNVSLGYAKNVNDLKKGDVNKKTLFTGDLAFRDKENYYYIVGRKKKFIKLFGKRLDLKEVKSYLNSKGIKVRCYTDDTKLKISLYNNFKKKPYIKNLLSKYLNVNPNYILVENNTVKNFKDFN